jgi:acyl-CoA synthetase (AMP-forming)/AMP-acid ligase II
MLWIGEPYPEQEVCIVDEQLQVRPPGAVGELCIAGTQVVPGYYRNPHQTQQRFVTLSGQPGVWYRTGDQVQRHPEWGLLFKGRRDDQMQVRGYRVERLEVEALIRNALGTDAVAVIGWPVVEGNWSGVGCVCRRPASRYAGYSTAAASANCGYMWPSQIYIQELPQTRSRKVDYTALRRQLAETPALAGARPRRRTSGRTVRIGVAERSVATTGGPVRVAVWSEQSQLKRTALPQPVSSPRRAGGCPLVARVSW